MTILIFGWPWSLSKRATSRLAAVRRSAAWASELFSVLRSIIFAANSRPVLFSTTRRTVLLSPLETKIKKIVEIFPHSLSSFLKLEFISGYFKKVLSMQINPSWFKIIYSYDRSKEHPKKFMQIMRNYRFLMMIKTNLMLFYVYANFW